ncbi:WYL domain-containing protein [Streptomyces decoyicus]|uniref:WYL domain-containing protein n=1 Tax=Streptomyces decoyicus TaxID=249567 RepID=UPI0033B3BE40
MAVVHMRETTGCGPGPIIWARARLEPCAPPGRPASIRRVLLAFSSNSATLPLFVDAVLTRRAVDVLYRRWRAPQEVRRRLRPYGLVLKSGIWYLVAAAESRIATYRVTQVLDAMLSDERFDRPQDFDLDAYWASYLDDFQTRRYTGTTTIRLSPRGRRRLPDNVSLEVMRAVESTATAIGHDGWGEAAVPTEGTEHACGDAPPPDRPRLTEWRWYGTQGA